MSLGLYLHIPFCRKKCHYCDFTSFPLEAPQAMASYLQDLHREISLRLHHPVDTVYIGGGTPSLCTPHQLQGLLDQVAHFGRLSPTAEITIEINPGTITEKDLAAYYTMGINRLSIGVQSMNDFFLKQLENRCQPPISKIIYQIPLGPPLQKGETSLLYHIIKRKSPTGS